VTEDTKTDWKTNNFDYNQMLENLKTIYCPPKKDSECSSSSDESESEDEKKQTNNSPTAKRIIPKQVVFAKRLKQKMIQYSKEDMKAILGIKENSDAPKEEKNVEFVSDVPTITHTESMDEYFKKQQEILHHEEESSPKDKKRKKEPEENDVKSPKEKKEKKKQKKEKKEKKEKTEKERVQGRKRR